MRQQYGQSVLFSNRGQSNDGFVQFICGYFPLCLTSSGLGLLLGWHWCILEPMKLVGVLEPPDSFWSIHHDAYILQEVDPSE